MGLESLGERRKSHSLRPLLVSSLIDSFGSSLAGPTMRSLVSTSTHASKQGRVLSVVAFVEAVAALVSPLFFGPLYAALVKVGQEHWGFWICACGCGLAWMLSLAMRTSGAIKISDESVPEAGRSSEERETRDSGRE